MGLKNLHTVYLAMNNLSNLSLINKTPFEDLINVKNLDLSNTNISLLSQDLKALKKLSRLNLAFNEFEILNVSK